MTVHISPQQTAVVVAEYLRERERILAEYPDLDPETLADTLEGETDAPDIVGRLIRAAREQEAHAATCKQMAADLEERAERKTAAGKRLRQAVTRMLMALGVTKMEFADFTVSLRSPSESVDIEDDSLVPEDFCKWERRPDRKKISEYLKAGERPNWAHLRRGEHSLTIRTK